MTVNCNYDYKIFDFLISLVFWLALYVHEIDIHVAILHTLNGLLVVVELFLNTLVSLHYL